MNGSTPRRRITWKQIAIGAVSVLVLAVVVFATSAISSPKKQEPPKKVTTGTLTAEDFASDADKALSQNQTETAVALATKALKLDPNNQTARRVMDTVQTAQQQAGQTETAEGSKPQPVTAGVYGRAVKDLGTLLPASYGSWTKGRVTVQGSDALVTFEPPANDKAAATVTRAALYVHDFKSESKASAYVKNAVRTPYGSDSQRVRVGIVDSGYFGTNSAGVAAVAFVRGRYAFEVLVTVRPGVKPASVKALGVDIASRMPAAR